MHSVLTPLRVAATCALVLLAACGKAVSCAEAPYGVCVCDSDEHPADWTRRSDCNDLLCRYDVPNSDRCYSLSVASTDPSSPPNFCPATMMMIESRYAQLPAGKRTETCP